VLQIQIRNFYPIGAWIRIGEFFMSIPTYSEKFIKIPLKCQKFKKILLGSKRIGNTVTISAKEPDSDPKRPVKPDPDQK